MLFTSQDLKHIHVTYSFDEILMFFWSNLADLFCLKFDFSLDQRNTVRKYILQMKLKQREVKFY